MFYQLKQKLATHWKAIFEMIFSTLLMASLIVLVTADFFSLWG